MIDACRRWSESGVGRLACGDSLDDRLSVGALGRGDCEDQSNLRHVGLDVGVSLLDSRQFCGFFVTERGQPVLKIPEVSPQLGQLIELLKAIKHWGVGSEALAQRGDRTRQGAAKLPEDLTGTCKIGCLAIRQLSRHTLLTSCGA